MPDTHGEHGPALAEYLDGLRGDQSMRQFCLERGLDDARVSAWRLGSTPRLDHLRQVADALELTLAEVLVAARLADEDEFTIRHTPAPAPSIDAALAAGAKGDPTLREDVRAALRAVLEQIRATHDGETEVVIRRDRRRRPAG